MRELGRAAEARGGVEGLLEAVALYHLAGARHGDSQAFYDLGALFERLHDERSTPAAAAGASLLDLLPAGTEPAHVALTYYRQSAFTAGKGNPHRWPPALAYFFLWAKTGGAARLVAMGERWEDALLLLLGLLLSQVLAAMAARARRRRERRQQLLQQEQQQRQPARVPSSPERRRPLLQQQGLVVEEERGMWLSDNVSASPPPVAASDVADVPVSTGGYDESSIAPREHEEEKAEPKQQLGAATAAACGGP